MMCAQPTAVVNPCGPATPMVSARRSLFRTRGARVCWLVLAIIVMSAADLHMTLTHLTSIGMGEANPIARLVMSAGSPALLVVWKVASVMLACAAFCIGRKRPLAEVAAWFCVLVLVWLMLRWGAYAAELTHVCPSIHMAMQGETGGLWVTMQP